MAELIKVGMADYKVGSSPDTLISYGLGSCVGIALFDPIAKVGGLSHIMLPDSSSARLVENPAKFADSAIPLMLNDILRLGGNKTRLWAKIAGGAQMFTFANTMEIMRIGDRNTDAVISILRELNIPLLGRDTGGNYGRTVELKLDIGIFRVKTIAKGEKDL